MVIFPCIHFRPSTPSSQALWNNHKRPEIIPHVTRLQRWASKSQRELGRRVKRNLLISVTSSYKTEWMANPQQHNDRHVGDPCPLGFPNEARSLSSILDKVVVTLFKDLSFKKIYFLCWVALVNYLVSDLTSKRGNSVLKSKMKIRNM